MAKEKNTAKQTAEENYRDKDCIVVRGARSHNLKNIDIDIPRDKLVIITGLSGSGKSSLAFDTIYAEGQRRYVESLSAYARQFLGQMDKPDVDYIGGLSPAIAIDQKTTSRNPRSTVGTVTEIHDYLRLLYARIGVPHCPHCGKEITRQSIDQMVDNLMSYPEGSKTQILAPVIRGKKGEHIKVLEHIKSQGFVRVRIDDTVYPIEEEIKLEKNKKHTIEVVVDRLILKPGVEKRLADSLELALELGQGLVSIVFLDVEEEVQFSQNFACPDCGISMPEISPRSFSFNNPYGACPACSGLGATREISVDLLMPDRTLSLNNGGLAKWNAFTQGWYFRHIEAVAKKYGFSMDTPIQDLTEEQLGYVLYGTGEEKLPLTYETEDGTKTWMHKWEGIVNNFQRRYGETTSDGMREEFEKYMVVKPCSTCHGARLKPEILGVTVGGKNIHEVSEFSIARAKDFFSKLVLTEKEAMIAKQILKEIRARLDFLINVGLDYLTLSRPAGSLSGGEAQRIRLATQIGSHLMGVLYILDEPSIGLHQRDNAQLIATLKQLRDLGNSVIVVEHDEETMLESDYIIDIGPGAGVAGGNVVSQGTVEEVMSDTNSITGDYLSGRKQIPVPEWRPTGDRWLTVVGAKENNLKNLMVKVPLGVLTCVTGLSGSGKSTLINEILYKATAQKLNRTQTQPGAHKEIQGLDQLEKVIDIDQSPIGRTPRSNPATYTGLFDMIRELFSQTNDAKMRGYKPGRFSFNVKGGRCEACRGDGILKIEMHFLPDVYVPCEVCKGKRYNRETLDVQYKGKNIADILEMTVDEAAEFFANQPKIYRKLQTMQAVGLGYVSLGQSATTLSGGEAQRLKLATELSRRSDGKTLYILDEPTTGLHIADVHKLIEVLNRLVDGGNSVVVIEHNLDVIKTADYVIDLGPEGGERGGEIVAVGTPAQVAENSGSFTGMFLKKELEKAAQRQGEKPVTSKKKIAVKKKK